MTLFTHVRACLITGLALGAVGCGPLILPVPPPSPTATSFMQADPRTLTADAGVAGATVIDGDPDGLTGSLLTGIFPVSLGYGLSERTDLKVTAGFYGLPRTGGLQVGHVLLRGERGSVGLTLGLGGSTLRGAYTVGVGVVDEQGQPVLDANGDPTYVDQTYDYAYFGLAPALGVRGQVKLHDKLSLTGVVRQSVAFTIARYGLEGRDMPWSPYTELGVGLVAHPVAGLGVGLAVTTYTAEIQHMPVFRPTFSLAYAFAVR